MITFLAQLALFLVMAFVVALVSFMAVDHLVAHADDGDGD
jgi:hypothetical protein